MQKNNAGKSRLFLIEFLIVLFFFLIISAVCLKLFAASYRITGKADALSHAQTAASSVYETIRSGKDLTEVFPECTRQDSDTGKETYVLCFDSDFAACSADSRELAYTLMAHPTESGHSCTVEISVTDSEGEILYAFSAGFYTPLTREEALS